MQCKCLLCFHVSGFYYTSMARHHSSTETSSPLSSSASAALSWDADDSHLDVQPYIISPHDNSCRSTPPRVPLEPRHRLSVVAHSHDCLDVVGVDVRRSPSCHVVPGRFTDARRSSVPGLVVNEIQRFSGSRRRRPDVAETSFNQSPSTNQHDIAVQVSLPQRPVAPSVPQLPRMGKLAVPICHRKSNSGDNCDHSSSNALTAESDLGGSLPCLPPLGDEMVPARDRVSDVLVHSELSTLSSCPGTGRTSMSGVKGQTIVNYFDEGYLTKESSTSTSSADTSRYSPVFF